ncbi:uncharacterized protein STEHIDRAFT_160583 [Stereum hirsutum FP-91666 SS1]|uniref:uncharacterized protein n=1 Tax=Stereum hirsutum (strain FP-91666) TaxID=721885 RepID=UPI0004449B06|nr:uncharacterized protein STEHIDRAFT_160583 [Stereum hirsutum FP-91666 SS1]EIM82971.1 hypothetical protein STEHIDRAFT_160583 [Stereum hirsutum FP-91666 SS1]
MRSTIVCVLGVAVSASAMPFVIPSSTTHASPFSKRLAVSPGQSRPPLPVGPCGIQVVGFKRDADDWSLTRRLEITSGQSLPVPPSIFCGGPSISGARRDVGDDIEDGLKAFGGLFLGGLGARDLKDDLETGAGDVISALPEIATLASKFLAREPLDDNERTILARGLGTTILHDAETIIPEALPLITSLLKRGLGTTILHDAETIIPEALPLITSLLKRGLGTTILHDAETIVPEALPLITSLLRRDIGDDLETAAKDVGSALPEILGLASKFLVREHIGVDDEPMLPSLTPLAGEFLRRDELEALAAMARREINDLD